MYYLCITIVLKCQWFATVVFKSMIHKVDLFKRQRDRKKGQGTAYLWFKKTW